MTGFPSPNQAAVDAIKTLLGAIPDHKVFDGAPDHTPGRRYFCVWDQTGVQTREKYSADGRILFGFQISCVARTREGARNSAYLARLALAGQVLVAGGTPVVEQGTAPVLTDGTANDVRITQPLIFRCHLPKEIR